MQPEIMLFELCEMRGVPLFSRLIYPICLPFARLMFLGLWSRNLSTAESANFALRDKLKFGGSVVHRQLSVAKKTLDLPFNWMVDRSSF